MYLKYFQLEKMPFHVTPDPDFLYLSRSHREALACIVYGVEERKGIVEVTGEVGTGKSTVLRSFLAQADPERVKTAYIFNPNVSFPALVKSILLEFGITPNSDQVHELVTQVHLFLINEYTQNHTVVLVVDEAQNMPAETLENLRLLSNLETSTDKLLQIVLCGQPELEKLLGRHDLRQLKQRIAIRAVIEPLSRQESLEYIRHRLAKAGRGNGDVFAGDALELIAREADGNPRVINALCDSALVTAYGCQEKKVSAGTVREIVADRERNLPFDYRKWGVAGLAFLLLLAAGFWVYATRPSPVPAPEASVIAPPPPVPAPRPPDAPAALQAPAALPVPAAPQGPAVVQGGSKGEEAGGDKRVGESGKRTAKRVARAARKKPAPPPLEELPAINDQVVVKRAKQQGGRLPE